MIANEKYCKESSATVAEVVLGVDTHLDVHLAVALDHLGRRLSMFSVPTTKKGYENLLSWAEGLGPLRCAGVEGTSSYGALCSPGTSERWGSQWWRSRDQSAVTSGAKATPTLSMPRPLPGRGIGRRGGRRA
jgi:hypothetical protein